MRFSQSGGRLGVHYGVQEEKGRDSLMKSNPGYEFCWISTILHANEIMGDLCEANTILLARDGYDYCLLADSEKGSGDLRMLK